MSPGFDGPRGHEILKVIPPFPAIGMKLVAALNEPDADLDHVVAMIHADVAISGEILRLSNSAAFARKRRIATVREGAIVLGMDLLRQLATVAALSNYIAPIARNRLLLNSWKHSVATAQVARIIARGLGKEQEKFYTAGLLADIGLMGLMRLYPDQYSVLLAEHTVIASFLEAEVAISGMTHCEMGASLASVWDFPLEIQVVAEYHHQQPNLGGTHMAAVVHWACRMASGLGYPHGGILENYDDVVAQMTDEIRLALPADDEITGSVTQSVQAAMGYFA